jgi:hypothetical protein
MKNNYLFGIFFRFQLMESTNIRKVLSNRFFIAFFQPSFKYIKVKETNFKTYRKTKQKKKKTKTKTTPTQ